MHGSNIYGFFIEENVEQHCDQAWPAIKYFALTSLHSLNF